MKRFLLILTYCLILLSCVSIAVTQVNGDDNATNHKQDDRDEEQSINIGDNE
jgi:hypothetical protein